MGNSVPVMPTGQGIQGNYDFLYNRLSRPEFNEVVQIDHQKICMTDSGYNQVLVIIDHFTKYAEAVPCITASAEEDMRPPDQYVDSKDMVCPMTFSIG